MFTVPTLHFVHLKTSLGEGGGGVAEGAEVERSEWEDILNTDYNTLAASKTLDVLNV